MARDELLGRWQAEVVADVLETFAHLDDVAMTLGGQEPGARALVLQERIGRDRRAVDDAVGLGQQGRAGPRPSRAASAVSPSSTPSDGSSGIDGTFASVAPPASSIATRSVNVPP